jgi:hypothetical protein
MEDSLWNQIVGAVQIDPQSKMTWLRPTRQLASVNGDRRLLVSCPNKEFADWIQDNYRDPILEACRNLGLMGTQIDSIEYVPHWPKIAPALIEPPPEREVPETIVEVACPEVPPECWLSLAAEYRDLVGPCCESSDNYHLVCFLTAMGAGLGKSVYVVRAEPIYPNLYSVLVGDSTWGQKTMAMNYAMRLAVEGSFNVINAYDVSSGQGLIEAIDRGIREDDTRRRGSVIVQIDEFNTVFNKASYKGSTIIPDLKRAFNTPRVVELIRKDYLKVMDPPTVTLLAGSEPQDLADSISDKDLRGGLGNRLDFTPGDPKPLNADAPAPDAGRFFSLATRAGAICKYWHELGAKKGTELKLSPEADLMWRKWYETIRRRGGEDRTVQAMAARHRVYVLKWATIFCALDEHRPGQICSNHIQPAIALAEWRLKCLFHIFGSVSRKPWVKDEIDMQGYVKRQGGRVTVLKFRRRFHDLGAETVERRMRSLVWDPKIPSSPSERDLRFDYVTDYRTGRESRWICINE